MPLYGRCVDRFLSAAANNPGPSGHRAHLWLTHRSQRDLLLDQASQRGLRGWLNPPVHFLSGLPGLFGIRGRSIGLLARREMISRIGFECGRTHGIRFGNADASITRGNMLDGFMGELLPEGVTPEELEQALASLDPDEFGRRRNAWVVATYGRYLATLARIRAHDPRSIHALVAARIGCGELPRALDGAEVLHIYGVYSMRARQRLLTSLAAQADVRVELYCVEAARDLVEIATSVEDLALNHASTGADYAAPARHPAREDLPVASSDRNGWPDPVVQPAPDARRELDWVATQVKDLIIRGVAEPHEVAVVARTGLDDTRRALHVLERAGIPATARVRSPLAEIAALRALLDLYRAAAERWSYRVLRNVLTSPYFRFRIDVRPFDHIATKARPTTLDEWEGALIALLDALRSDATDSETRRTGLRAERMAKDVARFRELRTKLEPLSGTRSLGSWIDATEALLRQSWFRFRQRICDPPAARMDVVRFDQRGVRMLEALLAEWRSVDDPVEPISGVEWFRALRSLLEGQELVLTTPGQKGVQILEAHDAALAPFKATFLIHANDGEFPRSTSSSGLFTDDERVALRAHGLPVDDRRAVLARERVLWEAVTAVERLHVSYRTTDARGTPLLPSLLVPAHDASSELPRSTAIPGDPFNIEAAGRAAASHLRKAIREGASGSRIATPTPTALKRAIVNAHAENTRRSAVSDQESSGTLQNPDSDAAGIVHSPWNGQLRDPAVLAALAEQFDGQYVWSASQLQSYTVAPFNFLLERVLGLQMSQEAEEDTNALASGGIAHAILERFYGKYLRQAAPSFESAKPILFEVAGQVFTEWESSGEWLGEQALWEQRRLWLFKTLLEFVEWDLSKIGKDKVWNVEHEIGGASGVAEVSGHDVYGREARMHVRGRIDRIDENTHGELVVIDYKSGSTPTGKSGYADGAVLQGPLYIAALHAEGHPSAARAHYRSVNGRKKAAELRTSDSEFARALAIALSVPARVRAGHFEAVVAGSADWLRYHPDRSIRRTDAKLSDGCRFDAPPGSGSDPSPAAERESASATDLDVRSARSSADA